MFDKDDRNSAMRKANSLADEIEELEKKERFLADDDPKDPRLRLYAIQIADLKEKLGSILEPIDG